jgi:Transcriptional regulators
MEVQRETMAIDEASAGIISHAKADGRKTIAILVDYFNSIGGGYEAKLREHLNAIGRELDLNLLFFYGRPLAGPDPWSAAHNAIFDLVHPDLVDGAILVSTCLAAFSGTEGVSRLLGRIPAMPFCSIGAALPGVPSVLVDNHPGMEAIVDHMVREHGCGRIAFLCGTPKNPEAEARLDAYRIVLARHAIPFDPRLVAAGDFMPASAQTALNEMIASGVEFDAVVASNDNMAFGAIEALRKHGRRVPDQIPVTGFDDLPQARLCNPSLTTVAQPFHAIADTALRIVLDQLSGRAVAPTIQIPIGLVIRQSCGCGPVFHRAPVKELPSCSDDAFGYVHSRAVLLHGKLAAALKASTSDGVDEARLLLDSLQAELSGQKESFVRAIEQLLESMRDDNERHRALAGAVTCLRAELAPITGLQLGELWYRALYLVEISSATTLMHRQLKIDESQLVLIETSEVFSLAFNLPALKLALLKGLPAAGIQSAFLARFPEGSTTRLEPFLGLRDGSPWQTETTDFPAHLLVPPGAFPLERRHTSLVFPLTFEAQTLGVVVFEYALDSSGYHVLRSQISVGLRGVTLRQQLVQESMLRERSVYERTATAQRMEALRVLAGGVAHDLNNALGPLIALPEVILQELDRPILGPDTLADVKADVANIRSAALHAAQTIKDLLTLSRQGRTTKLPLDFNATVMGCLRYGPGQAAMETNRQIHMTVDLAPETLTIHASEVQLARAITNLVGNAVEAISGLGEIRVQTAIRHINAPSAGYETVPPGDYAVLTISDNGSGIPAQDLPRIFEPFFSKKRTRENTGSGLGLAIVHGVVKEHDGFVDVSSTLGLGTTFSLYFPCFRGAVQRPTESKSVPTGNARILIVDDEPILLRTCCRVLAHLGYHVDTLESGHKAYEIFAAAASSGASPYDLVILDVILNEPFDGLEIYEKIQKLFPNQKAILASGHAPNDRARRAVHKGLPWLVKPYGRDTLAEAVHAALQGVSA